MKTTLRRIVTAAPLMLCLFLWTPTHAQTAVEAWVQRYADTGNLKFGPTAMAVDSDGNVIVTGYAYISGAARDYLTIKYSSMGELLWADSYNGPANDADEAAAVAVDSENNIIVTGYSSGFDLGPQDYLTIKYSSDGVPLWINRYHHTAVDIPFGLVVGASNDVLVVGRSDEMNGGFACATVRYSSDGVPLRTNRYSGFGYHPSGRSYLAVDSRGDLVVTGTALDAGGYPDFLTFKISRAGALLWTRVYSGPSPLPDIPYGIAVDHSNNVVVTGWSKPLSGAELGSDYLLISCCATR